MKIKGIGVDIYRFPLGDCTRNGISSRFRELILPCEDGYIDIDTDNLPENFCYVRLRVIGDKEIYDIRPAEIKDGELVDRGGKWYMMGGNFAYSSDSRFSKMVGGMYGAIAIHDRVEG